MINAPEFKDNNEACYYRAKEEDTPNGNFNTRQPNLNTDYYNTQDESGNTHYDSEYYRPSSRDENSYSREGHNNIARKRNYSNERSLSPSDSDYSKKARLGDDIDLVVEDSADVMQLMGFDGFNTTKNNHMYGPGSASFADIDPKNVIPQERFYEDRRGGGGRGGWGGRGGGRGRGRGFGRGGRGGGGPGTSFPSYNSRGGGQDRGRGGGEGRGRAPPPRDAAPPYRGADPGGRGSSSRQSNSYNRGPPGSRGPPPGGSNRRGEGGPASSYNQSRWR